MKMSTERAAITARATTDLRSIGQVVAELRPAYPDISPSALRFLEREGLVTPVRTKGGHRLYDDAAIDRLRTIKEWQAQRLTLADVRRRLAAQSELGKPRVLAARFLAAALAGDPNPGAMVLEADALGLPLARTFGEVLRPAMVEVGERWAGGTLRVGQEHAISEGVREIIGVLSMRHAHPEPAGPPLLAACVAGEHHDLGLRMVVALLRAEGRRVRFLGADVSTAFIVEETVAWEPAAVLLSATLDARLPTVFAAVDAVRAASGPPPEVIVGGQAGRDRAAEFRARGIAVADDADLEAATRTVLAAVEGVVAA